MSDLQKLEELVKELPALSKVLLEFAGENANRMVLAGLAIKLTSSKIEETIRDLHREAVISKIAKEAVAFGANEEEAKSFLRSLT